MKCQSLVYLVPRRCWRQQHWWTFPTCLGRASLEPLWATTHTTFAIVNTLASRSAHKILITPCQLLERPNQQTCAYTYTTPTCQCEVSPGKYSNKVPTHGETKGRKSPHTFQRTKHSCVNNDVLLQERPQWRALATRLTRLRPCLCQRRLAVAIAALFPVGMLLRCETAAWLCGWGTLL